MYHCQRTFSLILLSAVTPLVLAQQPQFLRPPPQITPQPRVIPAFDPRFAFTQACSREPAEKIAELLAGGADPNGTDAMGRSPLRHAVGNPDARVVPTLLAAGARPDATAMAQAGWLNKAETLKAMLTAGGKPDDALGSAAEGGHASLVKLLLDAGADPNVLNFNGESPLHRNMHGTLSLETVQLLVQAGAKLNVPDHLGLTPIRYAGRYHRGPIYDYLLRAAGGKEPKPVSDANSPAARKTTAALLDELRAAEIAEEIGQNYDYPSYLASYRELFTREDVVSEIHGRVRNGEKLRNYFGLVCQLGPDAEVLLPQIAEILNDQEYVLEALMVMSAIKPGSFGELPLERRQQTAANLYRQAFSSLSGEEVASCISALGNLGDVSVPYLVALLRSEHPKLRYWTCDCLITSRTTSAEIKAELINIATTPGELSTREQAIQALGSFGRGKDPQVKAALLALLRNPPPMLDDESRNIPQPPPHSYTAWSHCAKFAGMQLASFGPDIIDDVLPSIQAGQDGSGIGAITTLERLRADAMPRLIKLLDHDDERIRSAVVYALSQKHDEPSLEAICAAVDDQNERIAENATLALSQSYHPTSVHKMLQVAGDSRRPAILRATAAFGPARLALGKPDKAPELIAAIPSLVEVLEKGTFDQQGRAAQTLGNLGAPAGVSLPALRSKLSQPDMVIIDGRQRRNNVKSYAHAAIQMIERQSDR
jgi:HEAT repeat protein